MSVVDTKVVEMLFKNSDFEKNAAQSLGTLNKLSEASQMKDAVSGFGNLNKAINGVDFSSLASSIQSIQQHFTVVGRIFDTVLQDVVRKAEAYAAQIFNAIANPIRQLSDMQMMGQGWDKYNKKVQAVQTIMKATGEDIDSVSFKLQDLADYTDKTSYSYSQMVDNIGKFTANGVELGDAIKAIEGVANVAALSGVGATDPAAARAMYNFSQALAAGSVKAIDWKSIENANMATKQFKEQIIQTAKAIGTLNSEGETAKGTVVTFQNFRETLSEDWFTSDVLIATLKEFADAESEIGQKAYKAAAEAKTFQDALGAIQDAISSTWSTTFELIFGNYEDATKVWTGIQDAVIEFLAPKNEYRNNLLEGALLSPYKQFINLLGESEISQEQFEKSFKSVMSDVGIDVDRTLESGEISFEEYLSRLRTGLGSEFNNYLVKALKRTTTTTGDLTKTTEEYQKLITDIMNGDWGHGVDRFEKLAAAGYDSDFVQNLVNKAAAGEAIDWAEELKDKVDSIGVSFVDLDKLAQDSGTSLFESISMIGRAGGFYLFWDGVREYFASFVDVVNTIKGAFKDIFPPLTAKQLYEFIQKFNEFAYTIRPSEQTLDKIRRTFAGLFDILKLGGQLIGSLAKGIIGFVKTLNFGDKSILDFTASIGDNLKAFADWVRENKTLQKVSEGVTNGLVTLYSAVGEFIQKAKEKVAPLIEALKNFGATVKSIFSGLFKKDKGDVLPVDEEDVEKKTSVLETFKKILSGVVNFVLNFATVLTNIGTKILEFLSPILSAAGEAAKNLWQGIKEAFTTESGTVDISKILSTALAGGVGLGVIEVLKGIKDKLTAKGGILDGIKETFNAIGGVFEEIKKKLGGGDAVTKYINDLKEVAKALLILSVSLFLLSTIDPLALGVAVLALGELITKLYKFMLKLAVVGKIKSVNMKLVASSITKVAAAILILAISMRIIGGMEITNIIVSMAAIMLLLKSVTSVMERLGKIEGLSKNTSKGARAVVYVAAAILTLTKAVRNLADLDLGQLAKGIGGVYLLLAALSGFIEDTNEKGMSFGNAVGVLAIVASILLITHAVKKLGEMDFGVLVKGLGSVVLILTVLSKFVQKTTGAKGMIATGVALIALAVSLEIITNVISKLGSLSLEQWALGIVGMALAVGVMTAALMLLSQIDTKRLLGVSAAMLVFSLALLALTPAVLAFSKLKIGEVGIVLLTLVGIFTILGAAGVILGPIVPALLGIAGALALLGIGVAAFGAGLLMLAAAITALSVAGASVPGAVLAIGAAIVGLIPIVIGAIGQIILGIINFVHEAIPAIIELLADIIIAVCTAVIEAVPSIIAALAAIFDAVLPFLGTYVPAIVNLGLELVAALLVGLGEKLPDIIEAGANLIIKFLEGIGEKLPDIVMAGLDMVVKIIEGINQGIKEKGDDIVAGALEIAGSLISALVRGISDGAGRIWQALKDGISDAWNGAKEWLGINSPSRKFRELGKYSAEGFAVGAESVDLAEAGETMAKSIEQGAENGIEDSREGLNDRLSKLSEWLESNIDSAPVIAPVLDLSNVSAGVGDINTMLGNVDGSGIDFGTTGFDLGGMTSSIGKPLSSTNAASVSGQSGTTDQSTSFTNTFNITGDNPQDIANEISTILQRQYDRRNAVWA